VIMDINLVREVVTVLSFVSFAGIVRFVRSPVPPMLIASLVS